MERVLGLVRRCPPVARLHCRRGTVDSLSGADLPHPRVPHNGDRGSGGDQRRPPDPRRVGGIPESAPRGLGRRPSARTRRAQDPGHVRSHSQTHRWSPGHRSLHRRPAVSSASGLPARFCSFLVAPRQALGRSGSACSRRRQGTTRLSGSRPRTARPQLIESPRSVPCTPRCMHRTWSSTATVIRPSRHRSAYLRKPQAASRLTCRHRWSPARLAAGPTARSAVVSPGPDWLRSASSSWRGW